MKQLHLKKTKSLTSAPSPIERQTPLQHGHGLALTFLAALAISMPLSAQTITVFDAPGAGTDVLQGTYAYNIAPSGTIIGFSRDADDVRHGFIRSKSGNFIIFDAPGAGTDAGQGTRAYSINASETLTGFFYDSTTSAHGYVRTRDGAITVFDAPGAGTGPGQGTFPFSPLIITPAGAIAGFYADSADVRHGFLRHVDGSFETFDVPGAGTGPLQGTFSYAISPNEAITGYYLDDASVSHGFFRDQHGVLTTFEVPGGGTDPDEGTYGGGFSPGGGIMGNYFTPDTLSHGFLRDRNGDFITFDSPGAGINPDSFEGTYPFGINPGGAITGWYVDGNDVNHGFIREKTGVFITFDVPGSGTGPGQGPLVFSIAPNGAVTGFTLDPDNVVHGFVRTK